MGTLYWQLNDIWQGASWSSLEYGGQWKLSHYYTEQFFRPTIISPIINGDNLEVWLVCDDKSSDLMTVNLKIFHFTSFTPSFQSQLTTALCAEAGAVKIFESELKIMLTQGDCKVGSYDDVRLEYCLLYFTLDQGGVELHSNHIMAQPKVWSMS